MQCMKTTGVSPRPAVVGARTQPKPSRGMHVAPIVPRRAVVTRSADDASGVLSGEWEASWSLASYDDIQTYFEKEFFKHEYKKQLKSIMSTSLITCTPEMRLDEVASKFDRVSGLPVVDHHGQLVGVLSKSDMNKPGRTVADVMNTHPIAAKADARVQDAAVLMLKHKVHRIPVVDSHARCIGIVSRTDVFKNLENL